MQYKGLTRHFIFYWLHLHHAISCMHKWYTDLLDSFHACDQLRSCAIVKHCVAFHNQSTALCNCCAIDLNRNVWALWPNLRHTHNRQIWARTWHMCISAAALQHIRLLVPLQHACKQKLKLCEWGCAMLPAIYSSSKINASKRRWWHDCNLLQRPTGTKTELPV